MPVRRKQIRRAVETLLTRHKVTRGPVPVEKIVLAMGIEIKKDNVDDNLSGFLVRDKKSKRSIIGADRFTTRTVEIHYCA